MKNFYSFDISFFNKGLLYGGVFYEEEKFIYIFCIIKLIFAGG
jgi:hypothetical protein